MTNTKQRTTRGVLIASIALMAFIAAGCGSDDNPAVGSDPAPGAGGGSGGAGDGSGGAGDGSGGAGDGSGGAGDGSGGAGDGSGGAGDGSGGAGDGSGGAGDGSGSGDGNGGGDNAGGGISTSQFCDEGTAGTVPAQPGDPAVDSIAAAVPGAPLVVLENVGCTLLGADGSDAMNVERTLTMDRANLKFFVNGEEIVQGEEAFRWVDSREYCAKPPKAPQADGSVLEIVAKFRPDTNQPTYYRQKSSNPDGSRIRQVECIPSPQ